MKKFYSSLISVLLIMMLTVGLCVGCSQKEIGEKEKTNKAGQITKDTNEDVAEPIEVTFIHGDIENVEYDSPIVKQLEEKYNVNVTFIPNPDDAKEWLNLQIASGEVPDIIRGVGMSTFHKYVKQDIVMEIPEELIREKAPNLVEWFERSAGKKAWSYFKVDGKNYSIPNIWELGSHWLILGSRLDWLEEVGYNKEHLTIEEFDDAMRKIKANKGEDVYPLTGNLRGLDFVFGAYNVYPGTFVADENDKIVLGEVSPNAKKALELLHSWYKDGILDPEFMINKSDVIKEKFLAEKAGFTQGDFWNFIPDRAFAFGGDYKEALEKSNPKANVGIINYPKGPEGHYGTVQGNPVFGAGVMFSKELENQPEKVAKYLEIFDDSFDPEMVGLRMKGTEGVTYEITENGYEWLPPYDDEKKRIEYGIGTPFPACFNDYAIQSSFNELPEYEGVKEAANAKAVGKFDILNPIKRPIHSEKWTQIKEIRKTNYVKFIIGERPLDEFDEFVKEWKAAGGDTVLEEAQEYYDKMMK